MIERFEELDNRYSELERLLADHSVINNREECQRYAKELSDIQQEVLKFRGYKKICQDIENLENELKQEHDIEFLSLVRHEIEELTKKREAKKKELEDLQKGSTELEDRDIILEIRAGTGGQEASLFAGDLYRMYAKYAALKNWKIELMSSHPTELSGFKEVVFAVRGKGAYEHLRFESGVHRVQRVPSTEASGRIHTSAATVAVMVEPEEVDLKIDSKDIRVDVYRSSGKGGQGVNTADSAVRLTHVPSGIVVTCQDERSQLKNKNKAMRVLRARIQDKMQQEETSKISSDRKSQVGSGDRSEKIRTYNFPDRRITDHRIGLTVHQLDSVLDGDLDMITTELIKANQLQEKK